MNSRDLEVTLMRNFKLKWHFNKPDSHFKDHLVHWV